MTITREKFIAATGREPEQDDLERCNCQFAGMVAHYGCGWNYQFDKPQFMIGIRDRAEAVQDMARATDAEPKTNV